MSYFAELLLSWWGLTIAGTTGVGGGGAGGASAPPKVLICQKSGQNP